MLCISIISILFQLQKLQSRELSVDALFRALYTTHLKSFLFFAVYKVVENLYFLLSLPRCNAEVHELTFMSRVCWPKCKIVVLCAKLFMWVG
jgi:hypothetical protein